MANQRKPHEQDVLLSAVERKFVGYFGLGGQIGTGIPVYECPAEPPVGAVYEQEYVLYQDIELEDGTVLKWQQLQPEEMVPKTFLRGRVVTDKNEVMTLLMPPILRELVSVFGTRMVLECSAHAAVAVKQADDIEIGISLQDGDIPPPEGASHYPVGESPEEVEAAELADIRQDVKDGVYDDEENAAVGGGHPILPFPEDSDDGPRAA